MFSNSLMFFNIKNQKKYRILLWNRYSYNYAWLSHLNLQIYLHGLIAAASLILVSFTQIELLPFILQMC